MTIRPNLLVISTDQHRADCLGVADHPLLKTPNLDQLANQGVRFDQAFCQNPVCMPSRSCFLTGRYPETHRVQRNSIALPDTEVTVPALLSTAGYETVALGKMHFRPGRKPYGFQRMVLWEGGRLGEDDDYYKFLAAHGVEAYANPWRKGDKSWDADFQAEPSSLPSELYRTTWVGQIGVDFVREPHTRPFFAWISFPTPHHPFDPPAPYDRLYDPQAISLSQRAAPKVRTTMTPPREADEAVFKDPTEQQLRRVIAYYYGMITHIDEQIGRILNALDERDLSENTLVLFLSDHGESLGDHGLVYKGNWAYDGNIRIPLILRWPGRTPTGLTTSELVEIVDLAPTLLAVAGLEAHPGMQGRSLLPIVQGQAPGRDSIFVSYDGYFKCIRTKIHKLVLYPGKTFGELYDLVRDLGENENKWEDPGFSGLRYELEHVLLERLIAQEDPLPQPGKWDRGQWPWV